MIAIDLRFPAGRFHGTPWGHHVNEATPEWPPSPWRILRALVATWKRKLDAELTIGDVEPVFRLLATPPQFLLPPAAIGHSRHYMPWFKKGPDDRTLVFDGFVVLDPSQLVTVIWPNAEIASDQAHILNRLLENLGFLGRAEAWCEARLLSEEAAQNLRVNCVPLNGQSLSNDCEIVPVLCVDPDTAFSSEHVDISEEHAKGRGKQHVIEKTVRPRYDPNWHLCIETALLHEQRWSDPPGAQWVRYLRPADCFKVEPRRKIRLSSMRPQVARFALDSTVLPLVTETLPVAETARYMLMGIHGRLTTTADGVKGKSAIFSGKDAEGRPLLRHEHAYYLPTDEDDDGRLDHLTIIASDGFRPEEVKALDRLRELKSAEREETGHPLRVVLLGLGSVGEYRPFPVCPSMGWISVTPFVVTRHLKKRGTKRDPVELWNDPIKFITAVLREELGRWLARRPDLARIGLAEIKISPCVDEQGTFRLGARNLRPIEFHRFRKKRGDDGGRRPAGAFRLDFPHPVFGPVCLGHSAHFGMGLFQPCAVPTSEEHQLAASQSPIGD